MRSDEDRVGNRACGLGSGILTNLILYAFEVTGDVDRRIRNGTIYNWICRAYSGYCITYFIL